jgi:hypothetical protein
LVRDDDDKFLFDVSTIPHATIKFDHVPVAVTLLRQRLLERLQEQDLVNDARVQMAVAGSSDEDLVMLLRFAGYSGRTNLGEGVFFFQPVISHLLDKQLIRRNDRVEADGDAGFTPTPLGVVVAQKVTSSFPKLAPDKKEEPKPEEAKVGGKESIG